MIRGAFAWLAQKAAFTVIFVYRCTLAPLVGGQCRFEPSCSRYTEQAFKKHRPVRAFLLSVKRLLRCHPLAKGGYDPVPIADDGASKCGDCR
ncbi:MAG: membrane protein insertion efficiency factor YidD [Planctomycetota bacterium]